MTQYAVIFDMDGVLVDSYQPHYESWKRMADNHGLEMTQEQFRHTFGKTSREIIRDLWGDRIAEADIPARDAEKEAAYREIIQAHFPAIDGVSELLAALHGDGFKLAIGSSGPPENVAVVCRCLPGAEHFDVRVTGKDVQHGKPAPDVFLTAARRLGVEPAHCVVIEDAPVGVEAARRAGMGVVAITGTVGPDRLAAADKIITSHRELSPAIIRQIAQRHAAQNGL